MARIYIAASYGRMVEMRAVEERLEAAGHVVTSRWVQGGEAGKGMPAAAQMDWDDLAAAQVCLSFATPAGQPKAGAGRHTELGMALVMGKRCLLVGEREQVFHHLPQVEVYATLQEAMEAL